MNGKLSFLSDFVSKASFLSIPRIGMCVLILGMFGCSTFTVVPDLPCPARPHLISIPIELQIQMPPDAVWIVSQNQIALKSYSKKLETRAGCEM